MTKRKRLFITGAAGLVGTALRTHLRGQYDFRLLFHSRIPEVDAGDEVVVSDVTRFEAMLDATRGVDAVIHLALAKGWRGQTGAERARQTVETDIPGTYNLFEAARVNGVPAMVFASTNHVSGYYEKEGVLSRPEAPVRPDSVYGAGKAFGEALGRFYSDRYGMRVYCLRIANFANRDEPGRYYEPGMSRWLSPRDLAQLTRRCLEAENVRFGIFFGVSGGAGAKFDLSNARALLGYEPEDDGSTEEYRNRYPRPDP